MAAQIPSNGINLDKGLSFPATISAQSGVNVLDEYEEGTWTPVLGSTGSYSGQGYDTQTGNYTRIGRQVTLHMYIDLNAAGTLGDYSTIFGLPVGSIHLSIANITLTSGHHFTANWYTGGSARIYILQADGGALDQVAASGHGDNAQVYMTATFLV